MNETFLIVGLGNPGEKYEKTRHNVGFMIVDNFFESLKSENPFSFDKKSNAEVSTENQDGKKLILAKPQTFMNESGKAVRHLVDYYKVETEKILLVHDDLDLPFGRIRFSKNSGPAGHNGVKSVIQHLGTQEFARLRFGISPEKEGFFQKVFGSKGSSFVLQAFSKRELSFIEDSTPSSSLAIDSFVKNGFEETAQKHGN